MHHVLKGLLAGAIALTLAATSVTPAAASRPLPVNRGHYAAVGDSYAAGVGNPTLPDAGASLRSADAYPVLLAGRPNKVTFLAASGATTATVLAQVAYVPSGARQVTVTVGGNDIGFASLAIACAAGLQAPGCSAALAAAQTGLTALPRDLTAVIAALHTRAPAAHIYVTGYPLLFQPQMTVAGLSCTALPFGPTTLATADQLTATLNSVISDVVSGVDSAGPVATYVDVTGGDAFGGHGLCDGEDSYIFPPTFDPGTGLPLPASLHPTPEGQMAYAEAIAKAGFAGSALAG